MDYDMLEMALDKRSFRLLHLPQLVIRNVVNQVEPREVIIFSLCSKRMHQLAKTFLKNSDDWGLWIRAEWDQMIGIEMDSGPEPFLIEAQPIPFAADLLNTVTINGHRVRCSMDNLNGFFRYFYLVTYWEDLTIATKELTIFIMDLFGKNKISLVTIIKESIWILDWLNSQKFEYHTVRSIKKDPRMFTAEEYSKVLRTSKPTKLLELQAIPPANFQYHGNFNACYRVFFRYGDWINIDNLKAINSKFLSFEKAELRSLDLNQYLKHWLGGGCVELKWLGADVATVVFEELRAGIEDRLEVVQNRTFFEFERNGTMMQENFDFAYYLTRDDGIRAAVYWMDLNLGSCFSFLVQPDV